MIDIFDFADIIRVDIEITRYANQNGRWTASFKHAEIKEGCALISLYGNGDSPKTALEDYINKIKGRLLVVDAMSEKHRKEFGVPSGLYFATRGD